MTTEAFVRAYEKREIGSYRVEPELQSAWLRAHNIQHLKDLPKLRTFLVPSRIGFARIDWKTLGKHLSRKWLAADQIVREAQLRASSIHVALDYLRNDVGVANVHRFLCPLPINMAIRSALQTWARQWAEDDPPDEMCG